MKKKMTVAKTSGNQAPSTNLGEQKAAGDEQDVERPDASQRLP